MGDAPLVLVQSAAPTLHPLTKTAAVYLQPELELRLRFIIQEAKKLADHSFRTGLTRQDVEDAAVIVCGKKAMRAPLFTNQSLDVDPSLKTYEEIIPAASQSAPSKFIAIYMCV